MTDIAGPAGLSIDVMIESPLWSAHPDVEAVLRRAIDAAAEASSGAGEIAIVLTDDSRVQALNRKWRNRDEPTNVLSFPAQMPATAEQYLGDVVIAFETVAREAAAENKPFAHHLAHLAVHGYLHLVGYDHDTDGKADAMEQFEVRILKRLGIADPYAMHGT